MKRTVLLVLAAVGLGLGLLLLAVGVWLGATYGPDGTVTVDSGRVQTSERDRAVLTDLVAVNSQVPFSGSLGTVTLSAGDPDGGPVFLGYATPQAVDGYLTGRPYTVATADGEGGWTFTQVPGRGAPAPPGATRVWTVSATGTPAEIEVGTLDGPVTLVVMRPDARPRVVADLVLTFRSETVFPLAVGLMVGGGVLTLLGVALLVWSRRQPVAEPVQVAAEPDVAEPASPDGEPPATSDPA